MLSAATIERHSLRVQRASSRRIAISHADWPPASAFQLEPWQRPGILSIVGVCDCRCLGENIPARSLCGPFEPTARIAFSLTLEPAAVSVCLTILVS